MKNKGLTVYMYLFHIWGLGKSDVKDLLGKCTSMGTTSNLGI